MKIPALIDFSKKNEKKVYGPSTPEYKALMALRDSLDFKSYQSQQLAMGLSVRYSATEDIFSVQPDAFSNSIIKESEGKQILQDEEDMNDEDVDIEIEDDELDRMVNGLDDEIDELPIVDRAQEEQFPGEDVKQINNKQMQVVSLDDLMSLLQQVLPNGANQKNLDMLDDSDAQLKGGEQALKDVYFQSAGNETLNSEFPALDDNIHNLESHLGDERSYINVIGGMPNGNKGVKQPGIAALGIDTDLEYTNPTGIYDGEVDPEVESLRIADVDKFNNNRPEESFMGDIVPNGADRMVADLPHTMGFDPDEEGYCHGDDTELLLDIEEEPLPVSGEEEDVSGMMEGEEDDENFRHPDLDRFGVGSMDYSPIDNDVVEYDEEDLSPDYETQPESAINVNKNFNIKGQQVQIILTGVIITMPELNYIGESVKKAGNVLRKIVGAGNSLDIIVEANNKKYTINYKDTPSNKTKTPFSIKGNNFQSLEEALNRINYKRGLREGEVFGKIINEDVLRNEVEAVKDADIFDNLRENIKYTAGWNVIPVGYLNLKTCINETFSKITQSGKEPNTLILTETGEYYLIKGNMRERSKIGTRKEIVNMKEGKSYGVASVVGIYENTIEGLGDIMYEIKRTSVPLLVWK